MPITWFGVAIFFTECGCNVFTFSDWVFALIVAMIDAVNPTDAFTLNVNWCGEFGTTTPAVIDFGDSNLNTCPTVNPDVPTAVTTTW